jgi:hypothetical protein
MEGSKLDAFLEEVIKKTELGLLPWEKSAREGQFSASIGGKFSLTISGPQQSGPMGILAIAEPQYRLTMKRFSGEICLDLNIPDLPSVVFFSLVPRPDFDEEKVKRLYAVVVSRFASPENKSLDEAMDALKKL